MKTNLPYTQAELPFQGPRNVVENDVQRLTVDEFISARGFIELHLQRANPRSSADFSGAAERLMKLGIIDFTAVGHLLHPEPKPIPASIDVDQAIADAEDEE